MEKGPIGRASGVPELRVKEGQEEDNHKAECQREETAEVFRRSFSAEWLSAHTGEKTNWAGAIMQERNKQHENGHKKIKQTLFENDMTVHVKNF